MPDLLSPVACHLPPDSHISDSGSTSRNQPGKRRRRGSVSVGSVCNGASAALFQELTFENGRLQQTNFHTFPVMRMNECPEIETHIVENNEKSGGIGEPGVPCTAPAIANAVFAATGKRIRKLPVGEQTRAV